MWGNVKNYNNPDIKFQVSASLDFFISISYSEILNRIYPIDNFIQILSI